MNNNDDTPKAISCPNCGSNLPYGVILCPNCGWDAHAPKVWPPSPRAAITPPSINRRPSSSTLMTRLSWIVGGLVVGFVVAFFGSLMIPWFSGHMFWLFGAILPLVVFAATRKREPFFA